MAALRARRLVNADPPGCAIGTLIAVDQELDVAPQLQPARPAGLVWFFEAPAGPAGRTMVLRRLEDFSSHQVSLQWETVPAKSTCITIRGDRRVNQLHNSLSFFVEYLERAAEGQMHVLRQCLRCSFHRRPQLHDRFGTEKHVDCLFSRAAGSFHNLNVLVTHRWLPVGARHEILFGRFVKPSNLLRPPSRLEGRVDGIDGDHGNTGHRVRARGPDPLRTETLGTHADAPHRLPDDLRAVIYRPPKSGVAPPPESPGSR